MRGDFLRPPHMHFTHVAVEINKFMCYALLEANKVQKHVLQDIISYTVFWLPYMEFTGSVYSILGNLKTV